jgi:hypothetical protein
MIVIGRPTLTRFADLNIIPTHLPFSHLSILGKRPVLEAVTTLPLHAIMCILELVPELHGDLVVRKSEKLLAKAIAFLLLPLFCEKLFNAGGSDNERRPISPDAVRCVGLGNHLGDPAEINDDHREWTTPSLSVPKVLRLFDLRVSSLPSERRSKRHVSGTVASCLRFREDAARWGRVASYSPLICSSISRMVYPR